MVKKLFVLLILLISASACTRSTKVYEPTLLPTLGPTAEPTALIASEFPTPTVIAIDSTSLPTLTPTQQSTLKPYEPFAVYSLVDGLYLRSGPGTFFMANTMVFPSDPLTTNFIALGGEWLNVSTADGVTGFVFIQLLEENVNIAAVPRKMPDYVSVIKGNVTDSLGTPIQGVGIGFSSDSKEVVISTDENGEFYFYHLPDDVGEWTLTYAAIACKSNVWLDTQCAQMKPQYIGELEPASLIISMPYSGEPIKFTWK